MTTELNLIRHGIAVRVIGAYYPAPQTSLGQEQVAKTGQFLNDPQNLIAGLYSSPLRRTTETAHIIGEKVVQNPEFRSRVQELRLDELTALVIFEIL
jgi:broad specificity phosphatase PhoE